jgi:hypothetical protein
MTTGDYIKILERDLLELPGQPYVRCAICGQVRNVCATKELHYMLARFHVCEHSECECRANMLLEPYFEDTQTNY